MLAQGCGGRGGVVVGFWWWGGAEFSHTLTFTFQEQRKAENEGVTEDDVNEIKNDISAFRLAHWKMVRNLRRFELIEIMRASGMNTQSATGPAGTRYHIRGIC